MTTNDGTVGRYLGWFLAALSVAAGAIHLAVAGEHFDLTWWHGVFFAVVGWGQLAWAAAVVVRPSRRLLLLGTLGNLAVVITWADSRLWGIPFGPESFEPESVSLADALSTGFEVGIVLLTAAVLLRPALAQRSLRPALGLAGLGTTGVAIAVVSTMALSPSFAAEHHHGGEEAAGHDHADAMDHADGEAHAAEGDHAEGHTNTIVAADGTWPCEQSDVANEGNSGHGHRGPVPWTPMDAETQAEYEEQVHQAYAVAARFPTVADAEAAGYHMITPYVPCIAAHYIKSGALANPFDPSEPEILLYMGTEPDDRIVGLSFLVFSEPDVPPEGFPGENDPWHVHTQLCLGGDRGQVLGDETTTDEDCEARGGRVVPLDDLWMTHMWPVAGLESAWGLFSSEHPLLGGDIADPVLTPQAGT
jgi:hypothetical protein